MNDLKNTSWMTESPEPRNRVLREERGQGTKGWGGEQKRRNSVQMRKQHRFLQAGWSFVEGPGGIVAWSKTQGPPAGVHAYRIMDPVLTGDHEGKICISISSPVTGMHRAELKWAAP